MRELDLKDLRILDALFKTRNVSRASEKIGLSQPSVSIRLGQLRRRFEDALFVRTSAGMQPTPKGEALIPAIHQALALLDRSAEAVFDPRTSDRTFRICMTDAGQFITLPTLLDSLRSLAPNVRVEVLNLTAEASRLLESGDADLATGFTFDIQAGFYQQALVEDHFVCIVSKHHPRIHSRLSLKQFETEAQIDVITRGTGHWLLYRGLEEATVARRVAVRVPSFLGLARIVADSDLLALVPARMGEILAKHGELRALNPPIKLPSYVVKQYWHERYHRDPANIWLRGVIFDLYAGMVRRNGRVGKR